MKADINNTFNYNNLKYLVLFILLFIFFIADVVFGSVNIPLSDFFSVIFTPEKIDDNIRNIIIDFRIPKAITAVLVGIALSVSGMQMQTIFRNPLAGPYILGISSGASLGVALILMGLSSFFSFEFYLLFRGWSVIIAAFLGSGIVLFLILLISRKINDIMSVLIIGIMIGAVCSAIISILQYFSEATMLKSYVLWSLGSLGNVTVKELYFMIPAVISGLLISLFILKRLNVYLLGEQYAITTGVNIRTTRLFVFISTAILAGAVTAFCGPIAFIGVTVPHLARMLFKTSNHINIYFAVILLGAIVLLISDIIAHIPGSDKILPINAITSLIGIPVIIWIVIRNQKLSTTI